MFQYLLLSFASLQNGIILYTFCQSLHLLFFLLILLKQLLFLLVSPFDATLSLIFYLRFLPIPKKSCLLLLILLKQFFPMFPSIPGTSKNLIGKKIIDVGKVYINMY